MKYIAGIIIGLVLGGVGVVYAKASPMSLVEKFEVGTYAPAVYKIYDENNGAVCYLYSGTGQYGGISCLK